MLNSTKGKKYFLRVLSSILVCLLLLGMLPIQLFAGIVGKVEGQQGSVEVYFVYENPTCENDKTNYRPEVKIPIRRVTVNQFDIKELAASYGKIDFNFTEPSEITAAHVLIQAMIDYEADLGRENINPFDPQYIDWNADGTINSILGNPTVLFSGTGTDGKGFQLQTSYIVCSPTDYAPAVVTNPVMATGIASGKLVRVSKYYGTAAKIIPYYMNFSQATAEVTTTAAAKVELVLNTYSGTKQVDSEYSTLCNVIYRYDNTEKKFDDVSSNINYVEASLSGTKKGVVFDFKQNGLYSIRTGNAKSDTLKCYPGAQCLVTVTGFVAAVDKTALQTAINNAEALKDSYYWISNDRWNGATVSTSGFWQDMKEALAAAKDSMTSTSQEVIDEAAAKLNTAVGRLIPASRINATSLYEALEKAKTYTDLSLYTDATKASYERAKGAAETLNNSLYSNNSVLVENNYTPEKQAELEKTVKGLSDAIKELQLKTDVENIQKKQADLAALMSRVKALTPTDYTEDSWALATAALSNAEKVKNLDIVAKADADAVEAAYDELFDCYIHKLVDKDGKVTISLRVEDAKDITGTQYYKEAFEVEKSDLRICGDKTGKTYAAPNIAHAIVAMWKATGVNPADMVDIYGTGSMAINFQADYGQIYTLFKSNNSIGANSNSHIYLNGLLIDEADKLGSLTSSTDIYAILHEGDELVIARVCDMPYNGSAPVDEYSSMLEYSRFTSEGKLVKRVSAETGKPVTFTVEGKKSYAVEDKYAPIANKSVYVSAKAASDSKALAANIATGLKTSTNGQFSYTFNQPGYYALSTYDTQYGFMVPSYIVVEVTGENLGETGTSVDPLVNGIASRYTQEWVTGDWPVIGMSVYGRPLVSSATREEYVKKSVSSLRSGKTSAATGKATFGKMTDYARIGLALGSLGLDITNLEQYGYKLTDFAGQPVDNMISDMCNFNAGETTSNDQIFALILLDSRDYKVPEGARWTREALISEILKYQAANGSFSLTTKYNGTGAENDVDMTAMALQSLVPYTSRADVAVAVNKAITWLSSVQIICGSFDASAYLKENKPEGNLESTAQVLIALTALGIDVDTDARFIKLAGLKYHSVLDGVLSFIVNTKDGFMHEMNSSFNSMSTEQGFLALQAYQKFIKNGKKATSVYHFAPMVVEKADKAALASAINIAKLIDTAGYTKQSSDALSISINTANFVNLLENATQAQVDTAWRSLMNAICALEQKADKDELKKLVAYLSENLQAEDYVYNKDTGNNNSGRFIKVTEALAAGQAAADNPASTDTDISNSIAAITNAIGELSWKATAADVETAVAFKNSGYWLVDPVYNYDSLAPAVIGATKDTYSADVKSIFIIDEDKNIDTTLALKRTCGYLWGIIQKEDTYPESVTVAALASIRAGLRALEFAPDMASVKEHLVPMIEAVEELLGNASSVSKYTKATIEDLKSALVAAKKIRAACEVPSTTQEDTLTPSAIHSNAAGMPSNNEIAAMATTLLRAINNLEFDKSELAAELASAESKTKGSYELGGWLILQDTLKNVKVVYNCYDASEQQITAAVKNLKNKQAALKLIPVTQQTKDILSNIASSVRKLTERNYTAATWSEFSKALAIAQSVEANGELATRQDYFGAIVALNNAISQLARVSDKTSLSVKITEAEALDGTRYTSETWTNLNTALVAAKQVRDDTNAMQTDIDDALLVLTNAIIKLSTGGSSTPEVETTTINVTFTLLGVEKHGDTGYMHVYKKDPGSFEQWIKTTAVKVEKGSRMFVVFDKALREAGIDYNESQPGYIGYIKSPVTKEWLGEFDNGRYSGWMYTVNGTHPNVGLRSFTVSDGDVIVWHYTDDYRYEEGSEKWSSENGIISKPADKESAAAVNVKASNGIATITASELKTATSVTVNGDITIVLDKDAIAAIGAYSNAEVKIEAIKASELPEEVRELVGTRPVYDITIIANDKKILDFGKGKLTIAFPYTPANDEDISKLFAYYIKTDGAAEKMIGSHYDASRKAVVFTTNHLSTYAVGYEKNAFSVAFTDVPEGYWARGFIYYLIERSILKGRTTTTFVPDDSITRAEFVAILARMSGDKQTAAVPSFSDVTSDSWYAPSITWAVKNGITSGTGSTTFNPNANITRQDMAVMIMRYAGKVAKFTLPEINSAIIFNDNAQIAVYAKNAVGSMQKAGIINGKGEKKFAPLDNATRAEAAKMIAVLLQGVKK